ncbi:MAG: RuBisCO large subunit C-terminal-like domain-containing protein [Wenzhouxiangella sp.]
MPVRTRVLWLMFSLIRMGGGEQFGYCNLDSLGVPSSVANPRWCWTHGFDRAGSLSPGRGMRFSSTQWRGLQRIPLPGTACSVRPCGLFAIGQTGYCPDHTLRKPDMDLITASYIATAPDRDPEVLAENIAREQSLELTRSLIPDAIAERLLGRVLAVEALDEQRWRLDIGYPAELASGQIGQLLQLVYGNVSFYPRIRLIDLVLPDELLQALPGPIGGLPAIRRMIEVHERALLMTVLKPRGSAPETLAQLALAFARGGGDLIKDDQNLVEVDLAEFRHRISVCAGAVEQAAQEGGRRCLYLPHAAGSGDHLRRQLDIVAELGLAGVVLCTWIMGLESAASAARDHGLMWLAHPAMAGSFTEPSDRGVATPVLLGSLTRLAGADISVFPGSGGRLQTAHSDEIKATCRALSAPLGPIASALPCFGGGKTLDQVADVAQTYGPDCAVLVGGDIVARGSRIDRDVAKVIARLENATN